MKQMPDATQGTPDIEALPIPLDMDVALGHDAGQEPSERHDPGQGTTPPVPPPVWARYIESRLKQFCAR